MATYIVPIVGMIVFAVVVLGSVLLMRAGRSKPTPLSPGQGSMPFRDCYDLGTHDGSQTFNTMCSNWPGA